MTDRSCPSCGLEVAPHQTLCPSCRTPVPSEPGPVAASAEGSGITLSTPPPRAARGADPVGPTRPATPPTAAAPAPPVVPAPASPDATAPLAVPGGWLAPGPVPPPALASAPPPVPAPASAEKGNALAGLLGLAAAALVVLGAFLPWFTVAGEGVSGWRASADAPALVGLAAGVTVVAALLVGGARSLVLRLALVGAGLAAVAIGVVEAVSVRALDDRFHPELGPGLFFVVGGGLVVVLAGIATRHRGSRA